MRANSMERWGRSGLVAVLAAAASLAMASPAAAQLQGALRYAWGYTLVPDPPLASGPTTLLLYGYYPAGCGEILEQTVMDAGHVSIRLRSTACVDTARGGRWVGTFALGQLAAGMHRVQIRLTMDQPDSGGVTVHEGWLTFEVQPGSGPPPPPPPPPPPATSLLESIATEPNPPTPSRPMTLILGGFAPFGCPVVTSAAVIDTSHLALTLTPTMPCAGDSLSQWWTHRFDLGLQREGWHRMTVAITLAGDVPQTVSEPVSFLVFSDSSGGGPPPDSLERMLSPSRPNPFVTETRFSVSTDTPQPADVAVFDVLGRRVSQVFRGQLPVGTTELVWNGRRNDGTRAVAGVYFYRLEMRGRVVARRLVLLRQP